MACATHPADGCGDPSHRNCAEKAVSLDSNASIRSSEDVITMHKPEHYMLCRTLGILLGSILTCLSGLPAKTLTNRYGFPTNIKGCGHFMREMSETSNQLVKTI